MIGLNESMHGFTLVRNEVINEIQGNAMVFVHDKTKASLVYLSNSDYNKVFYIGFRTPSNNSTGIAHIMEHSVLCGSKKYPIKEPFVELAKGSMNTFLNAMTYPDKTVYPVASTNSKDFKNLMDVYLDAVFYPNIYDQKETFMQEGWHYHLEKPEDELTYNGVVYNEMKGVYSSPDEHLQYEVFKALYPDTIYGKESGGHPDNIPDLTYEDFLAFHQKYYHPSNAYIYLYGDGDVESDLAYLNDAYLSNFEETVVDSHIPIQPKLEKMVESEAVYPIPSGESLENKDYTTVGYVLDSNMPFEDLLAMDILGHVLLGHNTAPVKKALLDLKICKEVDYSFVISLQQPNFSISLKNTEKKHQALILKTISDTLTKLVEEGIDFRSLEAGINTTAFVLKEGEHGSYPRGLILGLEMLDHWLYDGDPFTHLKHKEVIDALQEKAKTKGFEALIKKYLLDNNHKGFISIVPDPEFQEKQDQKLAEKLEKYKKQLSQEEIDDLVKETKILLDHQHSEDSPEALATIPKLSLEEIDPKVRDFPIEVEKWGDNTLLWHPANTNGIAYLHLFFDVHTIPQEDLQHLSLLNKFLGTLSTKSYQDEALNQEIEIYTGGIGTGLDIFENTKVRGEFESKFTIRGKAFVENIQKLMELIEEIALGTSFENTQAMKDIISEIRMSREQRFLTAGNAVSVQRLQSYYSQSAAFFEQVGGIDFYEYLVDLDENFDDRIGFIQEKMAELIEKLMIKNQLTISLTCEPEHKTDILKALDGIMTKLKPESDETYTYHFPTEVKNEGFMTAAQIQYVSKGFNIKDLGYDYTGSYLVLKSILSMDYLWNKVRVLGGAYGASFGINRAGDLSFSSYRDPNIEKTIDVYNATYEYLEKIDLSQREIEKYIIGTISGKDVPLSAALLGNLANTLYFNQTTKEELQLERNEILQTTNESLQKIAQVIKEAMNKNLLCVVGAEEAIKENEKYFKEIRYIK